MLLISPPPRLPPCRPQSHLDPQQWACEEDYCRDERKTPPFSHTLYHLDNDGGASRAHQASHKVVRRRGSCRTQRIKVNQHRAHDIERSSQAKPYDERQNRWRSQRCVLLQHPAPTEYSCYTNIERDNEDLDVGCFERKIAQVIAAFNVNAETSVLGHTSIVNVHEMAKQDRSQRASNSKKQKAQSKRLLEIGCPRRMKDLPNLQPIKIIYLVKLTRQTCGNVVECRINKGVV